MVRLLQLLIMERMLLRLLMVEMVIIVIAEGLQVCLLLLLMLVVMMMVDGLECQIGGRLQRNDHQVLANLLLYGTRLRRLQGTIVAVRQC